MPPGKSGFLVFGSAFPFLSWYSHIHSPKLLDSPVSWGHSHRVRVLTSLFFSPIPKRWIWSPPRLLLVLTILRAPIHFHEHNTEPREVAGCSAFSHTSLHLSPGPRLDSLLQASLVTMELKAEVPEYQPTGSICLCSLTLQVQSLDPIMGVRPPPVCTVL